jgi:hypothetical protein
MTAYGDLWSAIEHRLARDLGSSRRQLPNLLGHISEHFYDETGLMLTALVVHDAGDEHPGEGFFREVARLGALPEGDAPPAGRPWTGMTRVQTEFWKTQVRLLFDRGV